MSGSNNNLINAKRCKNDEFYTGLSDIENELSHYKDHFKDKVIYCNCDDPRVSNFFHYFSHNFNRLGLKRLISSCYKNQKADLFSKNDSEKAVFLDYCGTKNDNDMPDKDEIGVRLLGGDGDFRNSENIALLKQADIVVTNPPFSLFREYMAQLVEHDKKFLIIGNQNAICYKEIFPLLRENKVWLGHSYGGMIFRVPDYNGATNDRIGTTERCFGNICWFTNLKSNKRKEKLPLFRLYNETDYPKYDNYDAINVDRVIDIPVCYDGAMGVPITFMHKHNPDQFDVLGLSRYIDCDSRVKKDFTVNGETVYMRVVIKHKKTMKVELKEVLNTSKIAEISGISEDMLLESIVRGDLDILHNYEKVNFIDVIKRISNKLNYLIIDKRKL